MDKSLNGNNFAFVCFKNPEEAAEAKHQLLGTLFDGKCLIINHYEIKEYRQVQIEEAIDKADFEKYRAQEFGDNSEFKWSDL
jgi:RNA recognition motif-containing protein